jgi:hypothetical protein
MSEEIQSEQSPAQTEPNLLERAEAVAKRIEEANIKAETILTKNEAILSRIMLSGRSTAGQEPAKPKEETSAEYAKRVMAEKMPKFKDIKP